MSSVASNFLFLLHIAARFCSFAYLDKANLYETCFPFGIFWGFFVFGRGRLEFGIWSEGGLGVVSCSGLVVNNLTRVVFIGVPGV